MTPSRTNSLLTVAILTAGVSFPLKWFTLTDVILDSSRFSGSVTALEGASLFSIPIWMLLLMGILLSLAQLSPLTALARSVPKVVMWVGGAVALVGMSGAILLPVALQGATANAGAYLGIMSVLIPLIILASTSSKSPDGPCKSR